MCVLQFSVGRLLVHRKQFRTAIGQFTKCLEIKHNDADALLNRGVPHCICHLHVLPQKTSDKNSAPWSVQLCVLVLLCCGLATTRVHFGKGVLN